VDTIRQPGEVTTGQAARLLGVTRRAVTKWCEATIDSGNNRYGLTVRRTFSRRYFLIRTEVLALRSK
jgi:hypothetical protein